MKCIQTTGLNPQVCRCTDAEADKEVAAGRAKYVPKSVWKNKVRDVE